MKNSDLPKEFKQLKAILFEKLNLESSEIKLEKESQDYCALNFKINSLDLKFRLAKITPTKIGQFVTLWQRNSRGIIEPFGSQDQIDFCIIQCETESNFGVFIFSKEILIQKGIFSSENQKGKLGFRAYPPWDLTSSKQATKTQNWQKDFFVNLKEANFEKEKLQELLKI